MARLIILSLIAVLCAAPAHADPLTAIFALTANGVGFGAAAWAVLGSSITQLLGSFVLSQIGLALTKPKAQNLLRELQQPNALPVYRYVYGTTRASGTPAPLRVKGSILYACYLLNSRPSVGPFTVLFDKREVEPTGDPYDFTGSGGATATNDPFSGHVKYWIGRGEQTSPPAQILSEAPELFESTDGWQGRTVLWVRLDAGKSKSRADRWPSAPPEVLVDGDWSLVWDPRDAGQDPDDPSTWEFSNNAALCTLDALRQNPLAAYDDRNVWLDTFEWAADVCDDGVAVKAGGTIPLAANGTLAFAEGSELEDQLEPLLTAGGLQWVRARGQLGVIPPVAQDIALTITDILSNGPARFSAGASRDSLATHAAGKFVAPDREYELTDLPVFEIDGALAADGGLQRLIQPQFDMVTDHRQAQYLQAILARQRRRQRTMTASFPPEAFDAVAGSWVELDLPSPWTNRSGIYQVESISPVFTDDEAGVVCRIEATLREISASLYDWTPADDEQDVETYDHDATVTTLEPPGDISTTSGADVVIEAWGEVRPRVRFQFDPSPSPSVIQYEWQWRETGGDWTDGGVIDAEVQDGFDQVFGFLDNVSDTETYEIRVRAQAPGKVSEWVTETAIVVSTGVPRWLADWEDAIYQINRADIFDLSEIYTLTRAGSATYVDASGVLQTAASNVARLDYATGTRALLVEPAGANAWTYSQEIDNAAWTKTRTTVTANAGNAPDGTATADKMVEDSTTGQHYVRRARTFASGTAAHFSLFAKAAGRSSIRVRCSGSGMTTRTADVNLSTGGVTIVAGAPTVTAYALADGWYWITFSFTPNASPSGFFDVFLLNATDSYTGDGSSGALIWGLQDGAGSYIATTGSTGPRAADVIAMRGFSGVLDLVATYGDGTTESFADVAVTPGFWPALTQTRIRRLVGTP
ncbi:phage head spike fiber domain-containing protein [Gemmobacter denitrificans]|uniref:Tip attachment protein J domain-containing protein n=1 Tax=Gemmobacter denitrificans TaxID=3123040 RepID=A0ABU8BQY1_9RHOB